MTEVKRQAPKPLQSGRLRMFRSNIALYIMLVPGILYFFIFRYIPFYGLTIAFKDFQLLKGIQASPWVGFVHFEKLFSDSIFLSILQNTFLISLYKLLWGFPVPIIFALMLNEVRNRYFKKTIQTFSYLPYFISWVILSGIFINIFSTNGAISMVLKVFGVQPQAWLANAKYFRSILVITDIWKGFGWGAVVYLSALSGVDPALYEAGIMDGANKLQRMWYITLPSIMPIIVIMLILNSANILEAGFDQIYNMYNPSVYSVAEVLDTYMYKTGLQQMQYSTSTAVGLFKSLVAAFLIVLTNWLSNLMGGKEYSLW